MHVYVTVHQLKEEDEWAKSGLSAGKNARVERCDGVLSRQLAIYPGFSNDHPWDNYRLCIVVECTACWPIMYTASVLVKNACVRGAFVLDIITTFAAHQVSGQALRWIAR